MITNISKRSWVVLILALGLWGASESCLIAGGGARGGGGAAGGARGGGGGGGGVVSATRDYPNSTMAGPVTVSVDPVTGQLIIITDDRTFGMIEPIIKSLDNPKPQVLIKVVFLEVTHNKALDFGVEGTYNRQFGAANLLTNFYGNLAGGVTSNVVNQNPVGAFGNNFGLAAQGTLGSQIGGNTMPSGAGLYSVLGNDFTATVRAISSASKTEVLSRPSILVRNSQPATITVGQSVPIITSVTYAANTGLPIVSPTYQDVGIILQVTPFIRSDNVVEMIVNPEISALSSTSVQIAPGFVAPAIDRRSASTVVVVPSGTTAIIGGLMQSTKANVDAKIPILGDIPILGYLFKRHQNDKLRKELLIFLTPQVVVQPSELASTTAREGEKADMSRRAFPESEYKKFFDTLPLKDPEKPATLEKK